MTGRLVAVTGPLKGEVFDLPDLEFSIGREAGNRISVADLALSRRHCLLELEGDSYKLTDLDSLNGTFVNGVPVKERVLAPGDLIQMGDSAFLFLRGDSGEGNHAGHPVVVEEGGAAFRTTQRLRRDRAGYPPLGSAAPVRASTATAEERLAALLKIASKIHSIRKLDALQRAILDSLLEVVPADYAAILLREGGEGDFDATVGLNRGDPDVVPVSRTVVEQVMATGEALLCDRVPSDPELARSESARLSRLQSVLCAPLSLLDTTLGAVYLASRDPYRAFDREHLELATGIGGIAAVAIANARHIAWLEEETERLQEDLRIQHSMVGESNRMREIYGRIARVAPTDSTVLIRGESGSGKELVARAVHANSARSDRPFVSINCAALTETLLESELFGHEKGAFTGAICQKKGKLEIADGGTLFLDEVGELAPALQVKLLRVLQEREFERVGGTRPLKVDIRLITATNRDLESAIQKGSFRPDLYYRLNVVSIALPPLRERREDIPLLAAYFVRQYAARCKRPVKGIAPEARSVLMQYDWPGNVRELENAIERAVVMGSTELIQPEDLPESLLETSSAAAGPGGGYHEAVRSAKREIIGGALEAAGGSFAGAARLLGLQRTYLHRLARNLGLRPPTEN